MEGDGTQGQIPIKSEDWISKWKQGSPGWHHEDVNQTLIENYDKLVSGGVKSIYLPWCGKSVDLKWLYDKGHEVVGSELFEEAVTEFFQENNLDFTSKPSGPFTLHSSKDEKVKIYAGDSYAMSRELISAPFDGVWDRGAFQACNPDDRKRYVDVMLTLIRPGTRYLLSVVEYDPTKWPGPPFNVTAEHVQEFFGKHFQISALGRQELPEAQQRFNLDWLFEVKYFLEAL